MDFNHIYLGWWIDGLIDCKYKKKQKNKTKTTKILKSFYIIATMTTNISKIE
jgi:arginyl-tRNA--protein-N-Asp/Glu arginylyltransferase